MDDLYNRCYLIQSVDGIAIHVEFAINYVSTYHHPGHSADYYSVVRIFTPDRRNTYSVLNLNNIVKKILELVEITNSFKMQCTQQKEATDKKLSYYKMVKASFLGDKPSQYKDEFTIEAGTVEASSVSTIKLTARLTLEEIKAVNDMLDAMRRAAI
jgi:hypothetical protein